MTDEAKPFVFWAGHWSAIAAIAAVMLLAALRDGQQHEFFINLRWMVCITSFLGVLVSFHVEALGFALLFVGLVVLFNPFLPVELDRSTWLEIDLATAIAIATAAVLLNWDVRSQCLLRIRRSTDAVLFVSAVSAWNVVLVHVGIALALLLVDTVAGDVVEKAWLNFRDQNWWAVNLAIFAGSAAYFWHKRPADMR